MRLEKIDKQTRNGAYAMIAVDIKSLSDFMTFATTPAATVLAILWKGDDAISEEFKASLVQKIEGISQKIDSSGKPVKNMVAMVFGEKIISISSFIKSISFSFLFVTCSIIYFAFHAKLLFNTPAGYISDSFSNVNSILMLFLNLILDWVSIIKSRIIFDQVDIRKIRGKTLSILLDIILTLLLLIIYLFLISILAKYRGFFLEYGALDTYFTPFLFTSLVISLLNFAYVTGLGSFAIFRSVGLYKIVIWALPIKKHPVRSIGIIGSFITFICSIFVIFIAKLY